MPGCDVSSYRLQTPPALEQVLSQYDLVCPESGNPELVDQVFEKEFCGERKRHLSAQAPPRAVVDVGTCRCHIRGCGDLKARFLEQALSESDVVPLAASLLSRTLRFAMEYAAAPDVGEAASPDRLKIAKPHSPVGENQPIQPHELGGPDGRLDSVQGPTISRAMDNSERPDDDGRVVSLPLHWYPRAFPQHEKLFSIASGEKEATPRM